MGIKKISIRKKNNMSDKTKYNSPIAQIIESLGNFFSYNSANLGYIIVFIVLIGGGFFLYKGPSIIANSINSSSNNTISSINALTEKMSSLMIAFSKQEEQNNRQIDLSNKQIEILNEILQEQKKSK